MIAVCVAFVVGVAFCHQLAELPDALLSGMAPMLLPLLLARPRARPLAAFVLGLAWTALHAHHAASLALPSAFSGQDRIVSGRVVDIPRVWSAATTFTVELAPDRASGSWPKAPCRVRLASYHARRTFLAGERWRLTARLRRLRAPRNHVVGDGEHRALRERLCAVGYVRSRPAPVRLESAPRWHWNAYRQRLLTRVYARISDLPAAGLVLALTLGERGHVTREHAALLRRTGTAHLVAISGLHIGLVAAFAMLAGRALTPVLARLTCARPARDLALGASLVLATAYAALAGFSLPTQRALIMLTVLVVTALARRRIAPGSGLALALVLVLLRDPFALFGIDLWLSFVATGALAAIATIASTGSSRGVLGALGAMLKLQCVAWLALVPVTAGVFGVQSWLAPLHNALAVPIAGALAVPLALAGLAFEMIAPTMMPARELLVAAAHVLGVLMEMLERTAALEPSANLRIGATPMAAVFGVIAVLLWLRVSHPWLRTIALVLTLPLLLPASRAPNEGDLSIELLDVGQGLAALVRTRDHALLFDGGPPTAARILRARLRRLGLARVDRALLSHGDQDHAGALRRLGSALPADELVSNVTVRGVVSTPCTRSRRWHWNGYRFAVLHPTHAPSTRRSSRRRQGNDASCVLHVTGPGGSVLLTGDIERRSEHALVARDASALEAEIMIAPHHGSRTSSTPRFLDAVAPRIVLVPSGHANRFGLPHREVIARYLRRGYRVLDTACSGAISVRLSARHPPRVRTWWPGARRFWHARERSAHCERIDAASAHGPEP